MLVRCGAGRKPEDDRPTLPQGVDAYPLGLSEAERPVTHFRTKHNRVVRLTTPCF